MNLQTRVFISNLFTLIYHFQPIERCLWIVNKNWSTKIEQFCLQQWRINNINQFSTIQILALNNLLNKTLKTLKLGWFLQPCPQGFPNSSKGWGINPPPPRKFCCGGKFYRVVKTQEGMILMIQTFFKAKNSIL